MKVKLIYLLMILTFPIIAQHEVETKYEVPELKAFHEVIYKIWHTAWPEKNVQMLKELAPDVKQGFEKIKSVKLPGILREKISKWESGVNELAKCVKEYEQSAAVNADSSLLNAAEKLHSQYEMMVRIVRPAIPSLENFHKELYMLYHHYITNYNYETVRRSIQLLRGKSESIMVAKLPERLKAKDTLFKNARVAMDLAIQDLYEYSQVDDEKKIKGLLEVVHTKYQALEEVFN